MGITIKDAGNLLAGLTTNLSVPRTPPSGAAPSADPRNSFQNVWNQQNRTSDVPNEKKTGSAVETGASEATGQSAQNPADETAEVSKAQKLDQTEGSGKAEQAKDTDSKEIRPATVEETVSEEEPVLAPEQFEAVLALLADLGSQMMTQMQDLLQMTPEETDALMSGLNLDPKDLLDPDSLNRLFFTAAGVEDSLSLLTDEKGYGVFRQLNETLQSVLGQEAEDFGIRVEDLLKALPEEAKPVELPAEAGVTPSEEMLQDPNLPIAKLPETEGVAVDRPDRPDREEAKQEAVPVAPTIRTEHAKDAADLRQATTSDGQTLGMESMIRSRQRSGAGEEQEGQMQQNGAPDQQLFRFDGQLQAEAVRETQAPTPYADTQAIANQVLDYIRSQVHEDFSSVEMHLHPASLGNLQISIANRDGVVTASFVAQSEQVKAVIESQMAQLQDRFQEQGVKVEAVEVTVQTHQFEQNLNQSDGQDRQTSGRKSPRRLRIDGDFTEEDLEDLEADEKLAAEMMAANGNTMDYKV